MMDSKAKEVKDVLLELAKDEDWTWEELDEAVCDAMRSIEAEVEARACGMEEQ